MQTRVLEQTKAVEFLSVEVLIDTSTADIVCEW